MSKSQDKRHDFVAGIALGAILVFMAMMVLGFTFSDFCDGQCVILTAHSDDPYAPANLFEQYQTFVAGLLGLGGGWLAYNAGMAQVRENRRQQEHQQGKSEQQNRGHLAVIANDADDYIEAYLIAILRMLMGLKPTEVKPRFLSQDVSRYLSFFATHTDQKLANATIRLHHDLMIADNRWAKFPSDRLSIGLSKFLCESFWLVFFSQPIAKTLISYGVNAVEKFEMEENEIVVAEMELEYLFEKVQRYWEAEGSSLSKDLMDRFRDELPSQFSKKHKYLYYQHKDT